MSARLKAVSGSCRFGHGNAGLASNFMDIAHAKLKPGGILALVLPSPSGGGIVGGCPPNAVGTVWGCPGSVDSGHRFAGSGLLRRYGHGRVPGPGQERRRGMSGSGAIQFDNLAHRPRTILEATLAARNLPQHSSSFVGTIHETGPRAYASLHCPGSWRACVEADWCFQEPMGTPLYP